MTVGTSIQFLFTENDANVKTIERFFNFSYHSLSYHVAQLDGASFSSEDGEHYTGMIRQPNSSFILMKKDSSTEGNLYTYNSDDEASGIRDISLNYNPKERPWYIDVDPTNKVMWTPPYLSAFDKPIISAVAPIVKDGERIGIYASHIKLTSVSRLLNRFYKKSNANVFIFDQNQRLIATSNLDESIISDNQKNSLNYNTDELVDDFAYRRTIVEIKDPIMNAAADKIVTLPKEELDDNLFEFWVDEERYFAYIFYIENNNGLSWSIVTSLSEKELIGSLPSRQRSKLFLIMISWLFIGGITYLILNKITSRIRATANAAKTLSKGEWGVRTPSESHISEIRTLGFI